MGLKEAYLEKHEAQLKEWDAEILKLQARAERAEAEIKIRWYEQLETLHQKRTAAASRLTELRRASGEAWETFRDGVENAWQEFKTGLSDALTKFK